MQCGSCYGNTGEAPNLNTKVKKKKADSRFALSNQNIVEQLKGKSEKQKRVESYTDLVECLANMGE